MYRAKPISSKTIRRSWRSTLPGTLHPAQVDLYALSIDLLCERQGRLLHVVLKRDIDQALDIGGTLHRHIALEQDGDFGSTQHGEHHAEFEHNILARSKRPLFRMILPVPLVVRGRQH